MKRQPPKCGLCGLPAKHESTRYYSDGRERRYWVCCGLSIMEVAPYITERDPGDEDKCRKERA